MEHKIQLTAKARKDLNDIYSYIKSVLFDEITAINQIIRLRDNMNNLNMFPHRYREHKDITWRKNALRMMPVDNYIVSYVIDENMITFPLPDLTFLKKCVNSEPFRL